MASVAEQLRAARESKHLTIQQVAEVTKIRTDHLAALEEGNYNVFSAPVYIRGFVRTYSTLLKLDVARLMAELDGELGQNRKFAAAAPHAKRSNNLLDFLTLQLSKVDWRKGLVLISIAVVVAGVVLTVLLVKRYRQSDPLKNLPPGVYQPARPGADLLPKPSRPARTPTPMPAPVPGSSPKKK